MLASGCPTVSHLVTDHHPARLAHRFGCIVAQVPTLLFETNRLTRLHRSVAARAQAHLQFMTALLRDTAGERDTLLAEAAARDAFSQRNLSLLASRHGAGPRAVPTRPLAGQTPLSPSPPDTAAAPAAAPAKESE